MITFETAPVRSGSEESPKVVYLDLRGCEDCAVVKGAYHSTYNPNRLNIIEELEKLGIEVVVYDVVRDPLISDQYAFAYGISGGRAAPIIFSGDQYYQGVPAIFAAFNNGDIQANSTESLRDPIEGYEPRDLNYITALLFVIGAGLIDGVNPCAIAMLLMFISMIGFTKNKKVLLTVSISYIGAVFVTYYFIGVILLMLFNVALSVGVLSVILYSFFGLLTLFLAGLTFYDFWVTRKEEYENVKNQLPSFIRKFNQRLMEKFTKLLEDKHEKGKRFIWFILIPVIIGILVGITEAACTGQMLIFTLAWLESQTASGVTLIKLVYLFVFVVFFIMPLIVIAVIAIKAQSTMVVANFVRENLSKIKFVTAVFFLAMAIYFGFMIYEDFLKFYLT